MEILYGKSVILASHFIVLMFYSGAGEAGVGKTTGKPLQFKGSSFHRVIKGFMAQVCMHCIRVNSFSTLLSALFLLAIHSSVVLFLAGW